MTSRQQRIVEMLHQQESATVAELSRLFGLTEASIRLDLGHLESSGVVRRFRGGVRIGQSSSIDSRLGHRQLEKAAIARTALAHVQAGETLYLDSGSTALLLAKELTRVEGLNVVTNSIPVFTYLGREMDKKVTVVGGEYSFEDQCCFGRMTERELAEVYVSKVFMGADSVDAEKGIVFSQIPDRGYIAAIIRNARQTILLADSGKFSRIHGMRIVDLSDISLIISDNGLPQETRERILQRGIGLEIAEVDVSPSTP
jgi:DeoR/GlpR family transcriptional regulator of sugar metabolism